MPFGTGEEAARVARHASFVGLNCLEAFFAVLDAVEEARAGPFDASEAMRALHRCLA